MHFASGDPGGQSPSPARTRSRSASRGGAIHDHAGDGATAFVTAPAVIDGTTQPGFAGSPIIQIDGTIAGPLGADGLRLTGGSTTVRGLVINRFGSFSNAGIFLQSGGGNVIEGNYLGTDLTGTTALSNHVGIEVQSGSNTIGGTTASSRNLLSGNIQYGVRIEDNFFGTSTGAANGNIVRGNFIGTDVTGLLPLTNNYAGIFVNGPSGTMIGGTAGTTPVQVRAPAHAI